MFDLIDRLERLGPSGAPYAVAIGLALAIAAVTAASWTLVAGDEVSRWTILGMRGVAFFTGAFAMIFAMVGVRLRTGTRYPDPAEVFPSLPATEFKAAIFVEPRPLVACSSCRIHLPAAFSTGACPRCSSSLNWHQIETDDDAELVCSAVV